MNVTCNRDCFNCPYPDCIVDDISTDEYRDINDRDSEIKLQNLPVSDKKRQQVLNCRARYKASSDENRDRKRAYQKKWYADNKDKTRVSRKKSYEAHKERRKAYQREYYEANKERLKAQYLAKKQQTDTINDIRI